MGFIGLSHLSSLVLAQGMRWGGWYYMAEQAWVLGQTLA